MATTTMPQPQTIWGRLYEIMNLPDHTVLHLNSSHANIMQIQIKTYQKLYISSKCINL